MGFTVGLGVAVGLTVGLGVFVGFTVGLGVAVGLTVGLGVFVGFTVGLGVAVGFGVGLAVGLAVGLGVAVGLAVGFGVFVGRTAICVGLVMVYSAAWADMQPEKSIDVETSDINRIADILLQPVKSLFCFCIIVVSLIVICVI